MRPCVCCHRQRIEQVPVCLCLCKEQKHEPRHHCYSSHSSWQTAISEKTPPHNEMWSIISRVGTRQFQNPPSDVFFFSPPFLLFIMFLFYPFSPLHLPGSPSLYTKHCFLDMGVPQLFRERGINEMLSPRIISLSQKKGIIECTRGFFFWLLLLRYDIIVMHS